MSSEQVLGAALSQPQCRPAEVIPMFVCPGVKDTPIDYALFPYGGGFTEPFACPGRDICLWYAAHDLGGDLAFNELPLEIQLGALFVSQPFSCPNFQEHQGAPGNHRRRPARKAGRLAAAKMKGCAEAISGQATLQLASSSGKLPSRAD